MSHRRFFWLATTVCILVLALVVLINFLVDPYGLFGTTRIIGVNNAKPMGTTRTKIVKPYQLIRVAPQTIVGGNSRPELGIDPAHDCWGLDAQPVYNAGIAGSSVYTQARLLQTAIATGDVKRVVWGLDFLDFLSRHRQPTADWPGKVNEIDARFPITVAGETNEQYRWQWFRDARDALLSLGALSDSWLTVTLQGVAIASTRRADGFNPARDYVGIVANEGQSVLFEQKNPEVARMFAPRDLTLFPTGEDSSLFFESVRFLLEVAVRADVEVTLFVNPYHADYLAAIDVAGKWRMFNDWKRKLLQLVEAAGVQPLWDFNAFDRYSTVPPPESGVKGHALDWFWEPAHYRKEMGDLMIARMTGCEMQSSNFGVALSAATIEQHLRTLEDGLRQYLAMLRLRPTIPEVDESGPG